MSLKPKLAPEPEDSPEPTPMPSTNRPDLPPRPTGPALQTEHPLLVILFLQKTGGPAQPVSSAQEKGPSKARGDRRPLARRRRWTRRPVRVKGHPEERLGTMQGSKEEGQCRPSSDGPCPPGMCAPRGPLSWRLGPGSPRARLRGHSLPTACLPAGSGAAAWRGGPGTGRASEALVDAQCAAGDVLQLPGHVVGHADAVVCQHLQHQPQVQPPLLPGHAVPGAGRDLVRAQPGTAPPSSEPWTLPSP